MYPKQSIPFIRLAAFFFVVAFCALSHAQTTTKKTGPTKSTATTLVGRDTGVTIIQKDGSVQKLETRYLSLPNQAQPGTPMERPARKEKDAAKKDETADSSQPPASPDDQQADPKKKDKKKTAAGKDAEKQSDKKSEKADAEEKKSDTPEMTPEEKAADEAARKAVAQQIQNVIRTDYAYFSDKDGKSLSYDEVNKRIAEGKVEGIVVNGDKTNSFNSDDAFKKAKNDYATSSRDESQGTPP